VSPTAERHQPALAVRGLSKSFGAIRALVGVDLDLHRGEVLGLLGDNGAGKSTLTRCIAGIHPPDRGTIMVDGREVVIDAPQAARDLGIETVHQGLALVSKLDVAANLFLNHLFLNREIRHRNGALRALGWLDKRRMYQESEAILERLQVRVPSVRQAVEKLSGGQRQAVAIGRALAWGRHIVLLDEPTAALGVEQSQHVKDLIKTMRASGVAVLLISHNMQYVLEVCDRAIVLRHGEKVGDVEIAAVTEHNLVALITGAERLGTRGSTD
jgi:simple sugar transport system ATP-binding protein